MIRFLLFLALLLPLPAQETMFRQVADPATDTHVEVLALFSKPSAGGWFPVRVKIANNLSTRSRVDLDFTSGNVYRQAARSDSSFAFEVEAGKTVIRDILVPLGPPGSDGGSSVTARLRGAMGENSNTININYSPTQPSVLLSESIFTPHTGQLNSVVASKVTGGYGSGEFAAKFDPKQLPDNWLAFSGYDSLIMTDTDWSNTPPGGRGAILSWVRLGGQLTICSPTPATATAPGLPADAGYGSIHFKNLPPPSKFDAAALVDHVLKNPTQPHHQSTRSDFVSRWPLQTGFGEKPFHYGLFVGVLILFAIVVGPVNFFVFAKAGQRHRLFVTTPLISLATSLILIGLIAVSDGLGGEGSRVALMEIRPDDGVNSAHIHQEQFCRTGLMTGSKFTLDAPALFQPVVLAQSRWARFTENLSTSQQFGLHPADGKIAASGDWFQSRSEHGFTVDAVVPTRGRIEKSPVPDTLASTFDFPIETLYHLDDAGRWHRAQNIAAGGKFSLVPVENSEALAALNQEAGKFSPRNRDFLLAAIRRPGHFVAITGSAPGIATHPSIRWRSTHTVITGPVMNP